MRNMFEGEGNWQQGQMCSICAEAPFTQLGAGVLMNRQVIEALHSFGPKDEGRFITDYEA